MTRYAHHPALTFEHPVTRTRKADLWRVCADCGEPVAEEAPTAFEAVCAECGDQFIAPADEDPADTLCVACAEEEQGTVECGDCGATGDPQSMEEHLENVHGYENVRGWF